MVENTTVVPSDSNENKFLMALLSMLPTSLTYSERYFILKFFQAPTDDADPDNRDTSNRGTGAKKGLSEAQVKRLYAIANAAGYDQKTIKQMVTTRYNKAVEQLTKAEYDHICNGLEGKK